MIGKEEEVFKAVCFQGCVVSICNYFRFVLFVLPIKILIAILKFWLGGRKISFSTIMKVSCKN